MKNHFSPASIWVGLLMCTLLPLFNSCKEKDEDKPAPATTNPIDTTDTGNIVAKGNRLLGFHVTEAQNDDYNSAFAHAKDAGNQVIPLTFGWNTIETENGWNFGLIDIIPLFFPAQGTRVALNLTPILALDRALPADLQGKPFDSKEVISRYEALIDSVHRHTNGTDIEYVILGLEVDLYLSNHPAEWASYGRLVAAGRAKAKKLWGERITVGVEATHTALYLFSRNALQVLNRNCDAIFMSYYPLDFDNQVRPASDYQGDIETVLNLYPNQPLVLIETGLPTSTSNGSSEETQAVFVREMFRIWDKHASRMPFMGFLWLTDLSEAAAQKTAADYGVLPSDPSYLPFKEYLRSTGLRTWSGSGTDKAGFTALKVEAKKRGWTDRP